MRLQPLLYWVLQGQGTIVLSLFPFSFDGVILSGLCEQCHYQDIKRYGTLASASIQIFCLFFRNPNITSALLELLLFSEPHKYHHLLLKPY